MILGSMNFVGDGFAGSDEEQHSPMCLDQASSSSWGCRALSLPNWYGRCSVNIRCSSLLQNLWMACCTIEKKGNGDLSVIVIPASGWWGYVLSRISYRNDDN